MQELGPAVIAYLALCFGAGIFGLGLVFGIIGELLFDYDEEE